LSPNQLIVNQNIALSDKIKMLGFHKIHLLIRHQNYLDGIGQHVQLLDPVNVLKRGFTITRHNGVALKAGLVPEPGSVLETETVNERISSIVTETKSK
jgi:exodeoxyribonuclease VII large subunit